MSGPARGELDWASVVDKRPAGPDRLSRQREPRGLLYFSFGGGWWMMMMDTAQTHGSVVEGRDSGTCKFKPACNKMQLWEDSSQRQQGSCGLAGCTRPAPAPAPNRLQPTRASTFNPSPPVSSSGTRPRVRQPGPVHTPPPVHSSHVSPCL